MPPRRSSRSQQPAPSRTSRHGDVVAVDDSDIEVVHVNNNAVINAHAGDDSDVASDASSSVSTDEQEQPRILLANYDTAVRNAVERLDQNELARKIRDLVRLALFCGGGMASAGGSNGSGVLGAAGISTQSSGRRAAMLKRDEINKRINPGRAWAYIFARAQEALRGTFGIELVATQTRSALQSQQQQQLHHRSASAAATAASSSRAASASASTAALDHTTAAFVVRSVVQGRKRAGALGPELKPRQAREMGVLSLVLALIFVHGGVLGEAAFGNMIKQFGFDNDRYGKLVNRELGCSLEDLMAMFLRHNYLTKTKAQITADTPTFDWSWGPRAKAEFSDADAVKFVASFYDAGGADGEDDDLTPRLITEIRRAANLE